MSWFHKFFSSILFCFIGVNISHASIIVVDVQEPLKDGIDLHMSQYGNPFTFYHDISQYGYDFIKSDDIKSVTLSLDVFDDNDGGQPDYGSYIVYGDCPIFGPCNPSYTVVYPISPEWVAVEIDDNGQMAPQSVDFSPIEYQYFNTPTSTRYWFNTLADDGVMGVTLTAVGGDFYFNKSTLTVEFFDSITPVPEPSIIVLMMSGLFLVGYFAARRKKLHK